MVARSPPKIRTPEYQIMQEQTTLLRNTAQKVDRALVRVQEIQKTVQRSPKSTRANLQISPNRGRQKFARIQKPARNASTITNAREGKGYNRNLNQNITEDKENLSPGEWRKWCSSAAVVQKALGEILEATSVLLQDPKTPQGAKILVELDTNNDVSAHKRDSGYSARINKKLPVRRFSVESEEIRGIEANNQMVSSKSPAGRNHQSLLGCLQEDGSRYFGKMRNQFKNSPKNQKPVYKFRMVTPEAKTSRLCQERYVPTMEQRRKTEKQREIARRSEVSHENSKARCQMSFSDGSTSKTSCGNTTGATTSALTSCVSSPTSSTKPSLGAEQITPLKRKPWNSNYKQGKAIMFPNQAFVHSPSDKHRQPTKPRARFIASPMRIKSTSTLPLSLRRSPPLKVTRSPPLKSKWNAYERYPQGQGKENQPLLGKSDSFKSISPKRTKISPPRPSHKPLSPKMNKTSPSKKATYKSISPRKTSASPSKSAISPKQAKNSPPRIPIKASVRTPIKMLKRTFSTKNAASSKSNAASKDTIQAASNISAIAERQSQTSSRPASPFQDRNLSQPDSSKHKPFRSISPASFRRLSSSFKNNCTKSVCFGKNHKSSAPDQSAIDQPLPALVSKLPKYGMPRSIMSESPILSPNSDRYQKNEDPVEGKTLPLPPAWIAMGLNSLQRENGYMSSDDSMSSKRGLVQCRSSSCPKQRPLKAVCNNDSFNVEESNIVLKFVNRQNQGKENRPGIEEPHDTAMKKPKKSLRRSWSFGHDNGSSTLLEHDLPTANSLGMNQQFLNYMKGLMGLPKSTSKNIR